MINVLIEVFKNSVEAMLKNDVKNRMLIISPIRNGKEVHIDINDNGEGIPQNNLNKIFNHGYTTKIDRYGFGLHNCANYINEMGGNIYVVQSSLKEGTTFRIELKSA